MAREPSSHLRLDAPAGDDALRFAASERSRVLLTVLFTDIVEAAETVSAPDQQRRRDLRERYQAAVRRDLSRLAGREIDLTRGGIVAAFPTPARALQCAIAIRTRGEDLGLAIRTGVHAGECEVLGKEISGIALHVGRHVAAVAGPGEILVSSPVCELLTGYGYRFEPRTSRRAEADTGGTAVFALRGAEMDGLTPSAAGV